jgi:hypothetical protein
MKKFIGLFYGKELNEYGVKKIDGLTNAQEEKLRNRIANKFLGNLNQIDSIELEGYRFSYLIEGGKNYNTISITEVAELSK